VERGFLKRRRFARRIETFGWQGYIAALNPRENFAKERRSLAVQRGWTFECRQARSAQSKLKESSAFGIVSSSQEAAAGGQKPTTRRVWLVSSSVQSWENMVAVMVKSGDGLFAY
jgi:hypothetical protein